MAHVFLSYVRENATTVDRLAQELTARGVRVWLDRENIFPGQRWRDAIREAIRSGSLFVACFSKDYLARERSYMNEELTLAIEELRQRPTYRSWFIPVSLDGSSIPARAIGAAETIHDLQWIDFAPDWNHAVDMMIKVIAAGSDDASCISTHDDVVPPISATTAATLKRVGQFGADLSLRTIAVSKNGSRLAVIGRLENIFVFDVATRQLLATLEGKCVAQYAVWSPDDTNLAVASSQPAVQIWSTERWTELRLLQPTYSRSIYSGVAFSSDCELLACAFGPEIWLYETRGRQRIAKLTGTVGAVRHLLDWSGFRHLEFSPDGAVLAAGSADGDIHRWYAKSLSTAGAVHAHKGWVLSMAFSPDGRYLASAGSESVVLWDARTWVKMATLHHDVVIHVSWSNDSRILATTAIDGVRLWDASTARQLTVIVMDRPRAAQFSGDRKLLIGRPEGVDIWMASYD